MASNLIFWQSEYKPGGRLGLDLTSTTTITVWKWNKISDVRLELFYFKLDLCCAAVDVQLNTGNKAGIIRCQKERSSRNLWRLTHLTLRDYGSKTILYFLRGAVKYHYLLELDWRHWPWFFLWVWQRYQIRRFFEQGKSRETLTVLFVLPISLDIWGYLSVRHSLR